MDEYCRVALDIGGTLAKVVCIASLTLLHEVSMKFSSAVMIHEKQLANEYDLSPRDFGIQDPLASYLDFQMFAFSSREIGPFLDFLKMLLYPISNIPFMLPVTGGGSVKFAMVLQDLFPLARIIKVDEIKSLAIGFSFLVRQPSAAFIFNPSTCERFPVPLEESGSPFPLLLVNIGSGVSMIKISSENDYARVLGTPIGGGTVLGLGKLLFGAESFDEVIELSKSGDASRVDISVGELIGVTDRHNIWATDTLASSLTKLLYTDNKPNKPSRADLAQSLVRMVSYNIGYLAYMVSCLHKCKRIYFSGKYINKHEPTMEAISFAVRFYENWTPPPETEEPPSPGSQTSYIPSCATKCDVRFLHREGYVGAIGALVVNSNNCIRQ